MIELHTQGHRHNALYIFLVDVVCHEHQHGTDALAAQREHISDRLIKSGRLAVKWHIGQCRSHKSGQFLHTVHFHICNLLQIHVHD